MNNEDMSDVFEKLNNLAGNNNISPDMVNNLFKMFNNSSNSNNSNTNNSDSYNNNFDNTSTSSNHQDSSYNNSSIDFETIMKMKSIIDKINVKDDPRSNLLQSLKPYLNENRKSKVDQYIQLMNMSKVLEVFPFMGGDLKK